MLGIILLLILLFALLSVVPTWGYSAAWGYRPSGLVGMLLIILIMLMIFGYI